MAEIELSVFGEVLFSLQVWQLLGEMVGDKRRGRVILQVRMRGINPRNPADHQRPFTSHLGFSLA